MIGAKVGLLSSVLPKVISLEVLVIEVLDLSFIHFVFTQVHENLLSSIQIDLHAVEDVLDQVRQGVPRVLLIVQVLHIMALFEGGRPQLLNLLKQAPQAELADLRCHLLGLRRRGRRSRRTIHVLHLLNF